MQHLLPLAYEITSIHWFESELFTPGKKKPKLSAFYEQHGGCTLTECCNFFLALAPNGRRTRGSIDDK